MYAVLKSVGKQFKVSPGDVLKIDKIEGKVGDTISFKDKKGFSNDEQLWLSGSMLLSLAAIVLCFLICNPMPIVLAFAFDAITVAKLEVEGI